MKVDTTNSEYHRLLNTDETGNHLAMDQILLVAGSGFAKSLSAESIAESYFDEGCIVISLVDIKDEFENCFTLFEPTKPFHLRRLRAFQKPSRTHPTKIYHPYTKSIPRNKMLPDIEFFTFNIKELDMEDFSYILESDSRTSAVLLLQNTIKHLERDEGLFDLIYKAEKNVTGGEDKAYSKIAKPDSTLFHTKSGHAGGIDSIRELASRFTQFNEHFFLAPESCPYNIDFKKMLEDNKHYHCLVTKWIPEEDKKTKYFAIFHFFNQLYKNLQYAKYPVVIVIEEVRVLIPQKTNEVYII